MVKIQRNGRKRVCKKCPKCGTEATTNVAPKCKKCGATFPKKVKKEKMNPDNAMYPAAIIEKATSALVNLGHKKAQASLAIESVCAAPGKDLQAIITEAIKYLSNGHLSGSAPHKRNGRRTPFRRTPAMHGNDNMVVTVNFENYPDLWKILIEASKKEIRQPSDQLMAMVADWRGIESKLPGHACK